MSVEFVDTNIFVYAHDSSAGPKHAKSVQLLSRLFEDGSGAINTQVLAEFFWAATKKLAMSGEEAAAIVEDLGGWPIHRPSHADLLAAAKLRTRHNLSWCAALMLQSAIEMGSAVLWTEDLSPGQPFGRLTVRNPFQT